MSKSKESLNTNISQNDLMAKKGRKIKKRLDITLSILVGIIYGVIFLPLL
mgnify:CR=1